MNRFKAMSVALLLREVKEHQANFLTLKNLHGGSHPPHEDAFKQVVAMFERARHLTLECGFSAAKSTASFAYSHYATPDNPTERVDVSMLATELRHLENDLLNDLSKQTFLHVPVNRRSYIDNAEPFGPAVKKAFPSAAPDLTQAGNCLAATCDTAAVFHLMRAVEWGLRALAVHLGFKTLRSRSGRAGKKIKLTPVPYSDWEHILSEMQNRVDRKVERMKRGSAKQAAQEFYYPALQDIRGIRDAWRNHIMHTRSEYSAEDADAIVGHVKRLLTTLATRVSEV